MMLFTLSHMLRQAVSFIWKNMKSLVLSASFLLAYALGVPLAWCTILTFVGYLATGGSRMLWIIYQTGSRDLRALMIVLHRKRQMKQYTKSKVGIPTLFYQMCDKGPNRTALIDAISGRRWSFQDVDHYSNRVANFFTSQGFSPGDSVSLFMESSPEYVSVWLGLAKVGIVPALINFNLRAEGLAHCIKAADSKAVIYNDALQSHLSEILTFLPNGLPLYSLDGNSLNSKQSLEAELHTTPRHRPSFNTFDFNSPLIYIYTSGTTGLPKAAKVVHSRYFYMSQTISSFMNITKDDVIYVTLPLYHSAGGILGIGQMLITGSCVVIRKKFSASNFWSDCVKYECTAAQYIGEICRYLLAQPERTQDRAHRVRVVFGNGLRPQIWNEFKTRYNLSQVGEFYGATEGNASTVNFTNTPGAVGFASIIAPSFHPISVIRVDEITGKPVRGADGLCQRADPHEPGELVGKIINSSPLYRFDGYASREATERKVARDVFSHGDMYFLSGDILVMDEFGYLYFRDRTGDTYRWKGENISTAEVEATVSNKVDKRDVVAYGVEIPGLEGRAGMVAIENEGVDDIDLIELNKALKRGLPAYSIPVFLRLMKTVEKTSTFKLKKVDLRRNGFNPSEVSDPLFYADPRTGEYERITAQVYADILGGRIRF